MVKIALGIANTTWSFMGFQMISSTVRKKIPLSKIFLVTQFDIGDVYLKDILIINTIMPFSPEKFTFAVIDRETSFKLFFFLVK